jgi:hypothetical protein
MKRTVDIMQTEDESDLKKAIKERKQQLEKYEKEPQEPLNRQFLTASILQADVAELNAITAERAEATAKSLIWLTWGLLGLTLALLVATVLHK